MILKLGIVAGRFSSLPTLLQTRRQLFVVLKRNASASDPIRKMIGEREIVGYGINGSPIYIDCPEFPFPAIRYREATKEICALQGKELADWKDLTKDEKKALYRYSFRQTFAEFQYVTPEWKLCLGVGFWATALGFMMLVLYEKFLYCPLPETYDEERRSAQLRRIIQLEMNPVTGVSSKWDYEKNKWKPTLFW